MRFQVLLTLAALSLAAAQEIPRPEYPQPQFQRADWLNLNGNWEFEFDDANKGLDQDWAAGATKFSRKITVPFCFESRRSGIGDTSFHPWVWYRRSISVPENWKGRRVLLHFGAVDYRATVWVNGRLAGRHEGGNTPFQFDITPLLKAGSNALTVRAEDPPTDRYIPRGKQYWEPKSRSIFYTRTSGIWQTVWLEAAGDSYLRGVRITPGMDGNVRFDARLARGSTDLEFHAAVSAGGKTVATASGPGGAERAAISAVVADPKLWSLENPQLYDVTFELRRGGAVLDKVTSYFGFRSVGIANGRVTLNGRPTYLKMILDQGYWPETILTPPSDEALQFDIRIAKDMGFNGARKHQKLEDPRFLYWADKMGFLVSSEMANAWLFDDAYAERFTREWMETVDRDYNHPSIVIWVPINESWGTPDLADRRQQNHLKALYTLTHSLDATRLVIDNEGWEHTNMTDLFALHDYTRTGELLYERYKELGRPNAPVPNNHRAALAPGYAYNGSPFLLSEFGGIAFIPAGHQVPEESWGYAGVEKSADAALERLAGLYRAIARIPAFAGICYTQLTDVEQEVNGLFTYDRKPKFDVRRIKEINDNISGNQ
ncbi:MAG: glycoside hydrolase family 2 [Candidatus Solibacter usitatus]|nr:glycoside hydrolase family 2 [Candidatus Solibacter usitatus]